MKGKRPFMIQVGRVERAQVPLCCDGGHFLIHEAGSKQGASLKEERTNVLRTVSIDDLLELSDRFVQQPHLTKRHSKIIMRLVVVCRLICGFVCVVQFLEQRTQFQGSVCSRPGWGGLAGSGSRRNR